MKMDTNALLDLWLMFRREHNNCSVDRMLCRPQFRNEFVAQARQATGVEDEETILWTLVGLRKKKQLPRVGA